MFVSRSDLSGLLAATTIALVFALAGCSEYTEQRADHSSETRNFAINDHNEQGPDDSSETPDLAINDHTERRASRITSWSGAIDKSKLAIIRNPVFEDPLIADPLIANESSWIQIWKTLHGTKKVPEVDFEKHFVYVDLTDLNDANKRQLDFFVDEQQTLFVQTFTTQVGFSPSPYLKFDIYLVPRTGISKFCTYNPKTKLTVIKPVNW